MVTSRLTPLRRGADGHGPISPLGRERRVGPHCQSQQFPLGVLSIYLVMVRAGEEKIAKVIVGRSVSLSIRSCMGG